MVSQSWPRLLILFTDASLSARGSLQTPNETSESSVAQQQMTNLSQPDMLSEFPGNLPYSAVSAPNESRIGTGIEIVPPEFQSFGGLISSGEHE